MIRMEWQENHQQPDTDKKYYEILQYSAFILQLTVFVHVCFTTDKQNCYLYQKLLPYGLLNIESA